VVSRPRVLRASVVTVLVALAVPAAASGATISGTVTSNGTTPIQDICANAHDSTLSGGSPPVASDVTDAMGNYSITVTAGTYKIEFRHCPVGSRIYVTEWWNDKQTFYNADVVDVTGGDATGISPQMQAGHTISGTVTTNGVTGIEGICVNAQNAGGQVFDPPAGSGNTASDGTYTTDPLPSGSYKVQFFDCHPDPSYIREWWNNQPTFESANSVDVSSADATGISPILAAGNTISGTVTDGVNPIQGVCVGASNAGGQPFDPPAGGGNTNASGNYITEPLAPGTYKVSFNDCNPSAPAYVAEWWNDKADFGSADPT
jgi:hypothetical protein